MEFEPVTKKLVMILNEKIEIGRAMNAIAHMALGLSNEIKDTKELRFKDYIGLDKQIYPSISDIPFIVLKGNKTQIRKIRDEIASKDIPHTSFISSMIGDSYIEQHKNTNLKTIEDIDFFGICAFGDKDEIEKLTKKFSLYK